ncbi:hypothetical protein KY285_000290 [Solanum tuberosum]|nr:hypothetical protein KY284_000329 [Solanum tuberosum]KAH0764419.1 hypothetical protein KY285_000290 [Solanum tuberosum]
MNKSQKSEEHNRGKFEKGQEGEFKPQTGQMKENKGSNSKLSIKEGKDADYSVQQRMPDSTMNSLNIIDFIITSLSKNKEKNCKKVIHDERSKEYNESKEKEQKVSFEEEPLEKQHHQQDINGISDEKDQNYHRLKQGIPRSTKLRSIIDIYKHTKRLSPPEEEYKVHSEGKTEKDQVNIFEETLPNKLKRNIIHGEFESLGDNRSKLSPKENKDEEDHLNKGISERIMFQPLIDLCEVIIQKEITGEHNGSETRKDQENSIEEELPEQQQQNIIGEPELNKVIGEDNLSNNSYRFSNDNGVNCGSKLLTRAENNGNYRITQGLPRSTKFRSISNLYKFTTRMSLVEDEYNWNLSRGKDSVEDSNMNYLKKEDSSSKKNFSGKRKCSENQKGN